MATVKGQKLLSPKKKAWIKAFRGAANGDPTEAPKIAGYKGNIWQIGQKLSLELAPYIASPDLLEKKAKRVLEPEEILGELSRIALNPQARDRIKAMEVLLGYHGTLLPVKPTKGRQGLITEINQLLTAIQQSENGDNSLPLEPENAPN